MLKNFLYLNEDALSAYISAMEGGMRNSIQQRTATSSGRKGAVDLKVTSGEHDRTADEETTVEMADTSHARFERLEDLATKDPERAGQITVLAPDDDLTGVGIGALIDLECEVNIPQ